MILAMIPSFIFAQNIKDEKLREDYDTKMAFATVGVLGTIGIVQKIAYKVHLKKSKKQLKRWEREGNYAKLECYHIDEKTGELRTEKVICGLPGDPPNWEMLCEDCVNAWARLQNAPVEEPAAYISNGGADGSQQSSLQEEEARKAEEAALEAARKAEEEARLKAEARKHAIEQINQTAGKKIVFDSVELTDEFKQSLASVADLLKEHDDLRIRLTGHTCKIGYKSINYKKGLLRAEMAKDYLVSLGVDDARIEVDSKGELEPQESNNTPEGRANNRRVELSVIE